MLQPQWLAWQSAVKLTTRLALGIDVLGFGRSEFGLHIRVRVSNCGHEADKIYLPHFSTARKLQDLGLRVIGHDALRRETHDLLLKASLTPNSRRPQPRKPNLALRPSSSVFRQPLNPKP